MPLDLNLPRTNGLLILGTQTACGKSLVTGGIARLLSDDGAKPGPFKPVAVRGRNKWDGLLAAEVEFLAFCARTNTPFTTINPIAYVTDAPPALAAPREHRPLDLARIKQAYEQIAAESDFVLVEGLDGPRTPLTPEHDLLDLAVEFHLPVILVARQDPSIINTTLMAVDCIRAAGLHIAGVVINGYDAFNHESVVGNTAPALIAEFAQTPILAQTPHDDSADIQSQNLGYAILPALAETNWKSLAQT